MGLRIGAARRRFVGCGALQRRRRCAGRRAGRWCTRRASETDSKQRRQAPPRRRGACARVIGGSDLVISSLQAWRCPRVRGGARKVRDVQDRPDVRGLAGADVRGAHDPWGRVNGRVAIHRRLRGGSDAPRRAGRPRFARSGNRRSGLVPNSRPARRRNNCRKSHRNNKASAARSHRHPRMPTAPALLPMRSGEQSGASWEILDLSGGARGRA